MNSFSTSPEYSSSNIAKDFFEGFSHALPYILFILRAGDFKILYANEKIHDVLGYSAPDLELMDGMLFNTVAPEEQLKIMQNIEKLVQGQPQVKFLFSMKTKQGETVFLEPTVSVFKKDENGKTLEYFGIAADVTERVEMEQKNLQLEQVVKLAEESFHFGKWEWTSARGHIFWSVGAYEIFEVKGNEAKKAFTTEKYLALIHTEDGRSLENQIEKAYKTREPYSLEYRIDLPNERQKHIREYGKPVCDETGNVVKVIGTIWDVTEQNLLHQDLKKYETQLTEAEKVMKLGTWEWDMENDKLKWSNGYWNMLEYPENERSKDWIPLQRVYTHMDEDNFVKAKKRENYNLSLSKNETPNIFEVKMRTRLGNTIYVASHLKIIEWKNGKPKLAVGSTADVTHMKTIQKNLEAKIEEVEKAYKEAEEFAYVASHDLQEPLRKITSFGERLHTKCGDGFDEACLFYMNRMMDGAARMHVLIDNLLTLSRTRKDPELFKKTDLNEVLEKVKEDIEEKMVQKNASINASNLPTIQAIPLQMQQMLQNFLTNSLKFAKAETPCNIKISSETLNQKQKFDYNLDLFAEYVLLRFEDNGIGFDPEFAEQIFVPFKRLHTRTEYEGTGIGLAICKKVVQNHNGKLWAEGKRSVGATFFVALPLETSDDKL